MGNISAQQKFCVRALLDYLFERKWDNLKHQLNNGSNNFAGLNPKDGSPLVQLSRDCLSARSNWEWQAVRSEAEVIDGIHYYEVSGTTHWVPMAHRLWVQPIGNCPMGSTHIGEHYLSDLN